VQLAQTLLGMLPPELAGFSEPEEQATEYLHYRQFFTIWETLARVVELQALEISAMTRERKLAWLTDYRVCTFTFQSPYLVDINVASREPLTRPMTK
jgi:nuclear pore complex protein Nup107